MSKLVYFMALVALVALLACGGDDDATETPSDAAASQATPAPTSTPVPTPTRQPTATPVPVPTNTPVPTPTEPPATNAPGQIKPLKLDDPLNVAGELSEAELACASGVADLGRLLQIFAAPENADPAELSQLLNCMEDETVLRLFITDLVGLDEPLSVEASECVSAGMDGVDARTVMLAGMAGDAQSAMAGSMSSFLLVMTCLNDEEFAEAAPALGVPVEDREGLICLLGELGGPENLIAALSGQDEDAMLAFFGAAIACGLEMEGGPPPGTAPIAPEPGPGTGSETPGMPGDAFASVFAGLSEAELGCLADIGITPAMLQDPSALDSATPEQQAQVLGCFTDETVLNLFMSGLVGDPSQLSPETSACIQTGMEGIDLRGAMTAGDAGGAQTAMIAGMSAMLTAVTCMSDEELMAAQPTLGMTPADRDGLECVINELGGPEGMAETLSAEEESGIMALFGASLACGLDLEDLGPGG